MSRHHPTCAIHHFIHEQTISMPEAIWIKHHILESVCTSCQITIERKISHEEIGRALQRQAEMDAPTRDIPDRVPRVRVERSPRKK